MVASRQADDVLELRLVLRGVNPLIWRRLLVRADASVADLHYAIQIVMGWEDVHLHRFHIRGRISAVVTACSASEETVGLVRGVFHPRNHKNAFILTTLYIAEFIKKTQSALGKPRCLSFRIVPMFFIQPNGSSTNFRLIALSA